MHEIRFDCDADVIILQIEQHGGIACHTGRESCFIVNSRQRLEIVDAQLKDPTAIYGASAKVEAHDHGQAEQLTYLVT